MHSDSEKVEAARAILAEIVAEERKVAAEAAESGAPAGEQRRREEAARQAEEQRRREGRRRCRAEGRIRVVAAFPEPAGLEWFLPGAGKTEWFKDLDTGPEMVVVPAGSFMMGSPPDEPERESERRTTKARSIR